MTDMKASASSPARWVRALVDLIYPPSCGLCAVRLHPFEQTVCEDCRGSMLARDSWRCPRCGATGRGEPPSPGIPCPECPDEGAAYRGVLSATRYGVPAARRCVQLFKYDRRLEMGSVMADIMVARLAEPLLALEDRIEWIVPVPLHWRRRAFRGFNQSLLLARRLSQAMEAPLKPEVLRRIRHTQMQSRLPGDKRAENVDGAFAVPRRHHGRLPGILLVDDVVTGAHTAAECARVLAEAGAPQIWVASFARG